AKAFSGRENAARTDAEQKNVKLYVLSRELIERYRSQGFWDAVRRKEPFTGLKQVEVENLLEQYRDRADEARVIPQTRR
ncbi:MAG: DNA repair protein, partial [Betaproteobacteria bacterium]